MDKMFKLFDQTMVAAIHYDHFEKTCVAKAIEDLCKDICAVSGKNAEVKPYLPLQCGGKLIVGTLTNPRFTDFLQQNGIDTSAMAGKWENYLIRTVGDALLIAGSDERGTMWGIYEFSQKYLGVDPLYLWTDHAPAAKKEVIVPEVDIVDGPKTYKFRGWFINDEDLIEGFCRGSKPDAAYRFHNDYAATLEMLVETALRLKQNLLIPCSHLDLDNPAEEDLVRLVTERGMYISMHHQEPVGVHQFTVDRYFKDSGIENVNYVEHPEMYKEIWTHYIRKWAKYDNVIWQLGLRGRGDRPVWYNNSSIPDTPEARGKIISDAIQTQLDIVKQEYAGKEVLSTSTLWMEGMGLYRQDALKFPEGTAVIFADFGPNQMWGEGYYDTKRDKDTNYGGYYHVCFWGCGPHLIQGNPPEKIYYNYKAAVEKGDNYYSVLNVSNFREHVYGVECVAEITWDIDRFCVEDFSRRWCEKEYGNAEPAKLYSDWFNCFYEMDHERIDKQMMFMDGMSRRVAMKLMEIIKGSELQRMDIQNKKLFDFDKTDDFIAYYLHATETGLKRFRQFYHKAMQVRKSIPAERKGFFTNNIIVQTEIMIGLYEWVKDLCLAAQNRRSHGEDAAYEEYIHDAVYALEKILLDREKALDGKWTHWYDGDTLMNIPADIELTEGLHIENVHKDVELDIYASKF